MGFIYAMLPMWVFAANVMLQIALSRYVFCSSLLKATLTSFSIGLGALLLLEGFFFGVIKSMVPLADMFGYAMLHMLTYISLGYCYVHFVNLGETARRIRLMRELYEAPGGLSREQILSKYNAAVILENRIGRLLTNEQIRREGGRYFIQRRFMIVTALGIVALKKFLLGKSSERE